MDIPEQLLEKYHMRPLSELIQFIPEDQFYRQFLEATDYEMSKALERLLNDPINFEQTLLDLNKEYGELIKWRIYARNELRKLN